MSWPYLALHHERLVGVRVRAVLFDFDHTLVDLGSHVRWRDASAEVRATYLAAGVPEPAIEGIRGAHSLYAHLATAEVLPPDRLAAVQREASEVLARYEREAIDATALLPGARDCLCTLAALGVPAGIVTSNPRDVVLEIVRREGVESAFGAIVSRDDVRLPKPSPEGILAACAGIGIPPEHTAYAGDNIVDVEAGRAASVAAVFGVRGGNSDGDALLAAGADAVLDDVGQLVRTGAAQ